MAVLPPSATSWMFAAGRRYRIGRPKLAGRFWWLNVDFSSVDFAVLILSGPGPEQAQSGPVVCGDERRWERAGRSFRRAFDGRKGLTGATGAVAKKGIRDVTVR